VYADRNYKAVTPKLNESCLELKAAFLRQHLLRRLEHHTARFEEYSQSYRPR